ncbi:hypothetical protein IBX35_01590 [Candidatus Bathyarchaeota archaeon]|nr:hypothetical protein [Candidatus Bathyarchaeota archaeon]
MSKNIRCLESHYRISQNKRHPIRTEEILGHKNIQNTLIYIDLEKALYNNTKTDEFIARVATNIGEACRLVETGFEYVTGDYADGGKIFRKRK